MQRQTLLLLVLAPIAVLACERFIGADFSGPHLEECFPVVLLPPPKITGAGSGPDVVLVTSSIDLGEYDRPDGAPGYATIGYSLDGLCSRDKACAPPAWTGAHPIKGLGGRDNGLGELMHAQDEFFHQVVFKSAVLSENIKKGIHAPLVVIQVAGYSGFVDDDEVEVTLYAASPQGADGNPFIPRWDGTDEWPLAPALPVASGADGGPSSAEPARYVDAHAYVSKYSLSAHFAGGGTIRFANVPFVASELFLTGKIDPNNKTIMSGVVAGRLPISEMFRHVPDVTQLLIGQTLCTDNPNYGPIKNYFCSFTDVRSDMTARGDCDSLSLGVAFETKAAKLGKVVVPVTVPDPCSPETSPNKDTCARPPR